MIRKTKTLAKLTAIMLALSGILVSAATPEDKFDADKSWNNMVWVTYGTHDGSGNPARNFTVKNEYGKELSYSLVETFDNDDAKYWIIANDRYGTKGTGTSVVYDPTVEGSIAKYVNEAFVQSNAWEWNLPQSVIECLDFDHKWMTEKAFSGEEVTKAYEIEAAVVIPAIWEVEQYGENMMINFLPQYNSNYVFRTPYNDSYYHGIKLNSIKEANGKYVFQLTPLGAGSAARGVRPEFFVNSQFFKTVAVDLSTAGSDIISEIEKYSYQELSMLYSDEDIKMYLPSIDVPEPVATIRIKTTDEKKADVGNTVEAIVGGEAIKSEEPVYTWYADDTLIEGETEDTLVLNYEHYGKSISCEILIAGEKVRSNALTVGGDFNETTYPNMSWVSIGGYNGQGNADYDFTVDGKSFTLIKEFNNSKSKYMVIANELYGTKSIGQTTAIYNPSEPDSFGEYANNTVGKESLPESITEHIDFDHVWITEKAHVGTDITNPHTVRAGVVAPAVWEMVGYADRIKVKTGGEYKQFVFRTPYNTTHYHALSDADGEQLQLMGSNYRWKLTPKNVSGSGAIRPLFFLDDEFFKAVKLDLAKTGNEIKDILRAECTREELLEIYSEEELIAGGFGENYSVDVIWGNDEGLAGAEEITASVTVNSNMSNDKNMVLVMELFDEDNNIVGMDAIRLTASGNDTTCSEEDLAIKNLSGVTDEYKLKIFIWDSIVSMKSVKDAIVYGEN